MSKMRLYKFWNENGDEKEKEALSLKKAVMAVQGDYKDKVIGRKIRQALVIEQKRLAIKAAKEARDKSRYARG